jgi:DHA1 family multidrug resistance protein-like MFS transporter
VIRYVPVACHVHPRANAQFAGQIIHNLTGGKLLKYAEERPGFELPDKYKPGYSEKKQKPTRSRSGGRPGAGGERGSEETVTGSREDESEDQESEGQGEGKDSDSIIVGWYGDDDPENPQNWWVLSSFTSI